MRTKVKKRRIDWRDVIFHLHRKEVSEAYTLFRVGHFNMSLNRCAYCVLKSYYSTAIMRLWRRMYEHEGFDYPLIFGLLKVNAYAM